MAYRSSNLHVPILAYNRLEGDCRLKALVLQLAAVAPVAVDTTDRIREALQGKQVVGLVQEVVEPYA